MSSGSHRAPPTVMLKQDVYEPFGEKICLEKLHKVGRTTDAIRKTAAWIFHHREKMPQFVRIWIAEFKRASPSRRLNLYYVAHETLALCKKRKFDKGFSCFQSVLREATVYSRDRECKIGVRKVFNIFAEAAFFPEEFLQNLREDLERGKSLTNYNKTVLMDFDPAVITSIHEHMEEFREPGLAKLEAQYAEKDNALQIGPAVISKIKEHSMGKEYMQQFDSAFITMTELMEAREQDLKHEYDLLNQLELLRVYYSTTAKEADKVIVAYGKYDYAAQIGMKHLEKAQGLMSIPLPGRGAGDSKSPIKMATQAEIESVDMEMSDEEDAVLEKQEPPSVTASQQPNFESILSNFTTAQQHSSPPFGQYPQQTSPGPHNSQQMLFPGAPSTLLTPQPRLPNFRPHCEPRASAPFSPDTRFFSPRNPGGFEQNRFPFEQRPQFEQNNGRFPVQGQFDQQRNRGPPPGGQFDQNTGRFTAPTNFDQNGGQFPSPEQNFEQNDRHLGLRPNFESGNRFTSPGPGFERFPQPRPHFDRFPSPEQANSRFPQFLPRNDSPGQRSSFGGYRPGFGERSHDGMAFNGSSNGGDRFSSPQAGFRMNTPGNVVEDGHARLSGPPSFANAHNSVLPEHLPRKSSALREIPIMASSPSPQASSPVSSLSTTPKPTALNFDEDNFDAEPEESEESPHRSFDEEKRPLLHLPGGFTRAARFQHPSPDRSPPRHYPPANNISPEPSQHHRPPFRPDFGFRPDFHPRGDFRPDFGQFRPQPPFPHDFRQRGPLIPNGGPFPSQPPSPNRFSALRPAFFEDSRNSAGGNANFAPLGQVRHTAPSEEISLTERLRRLAESQSGSSNIVLTSAGGTGRGSHPRR